MSQDSPKVFLATYSSTDVYESVINDCPLMRRRKDDWVNATQILKCCNFPKAKRTKILEKGVQQGLHEKIQGGYGRFQGTWIPLPDAQRLAHTYGVTPEMAPVLFFDSSNPGFEFHKKTKEVNKDGTPVKRKYVKKKKPDGVTPKKMKLEDGQPYLPQQVHHQSSVHQQQQQQLQPSSQPFEFNPNDSFNGISRMPSQLSQYSNGSSLPMQYSQSSFTQSDYGMPTTTHNIPTFQNNGQQPINEYNYQTQLQLQQQQVGHQPSKNSYNNYGFQQPQQPPPTIAHPNIMGQFHHSKTTGSQSTNETNWSQDEHKESDTSMSSNEEMKIKSNTTGTNNLLDSKESYSAQLLKYFSDDNAPIPYFITNPPYDFNINEAIDDEGHTPLHWASSIGNYNMIHLLTMKGANALVVNNYGLNPLSKLISFNNCYELKNFPKVLDDLEICLINTDINGRTPLHYLCQFSKVPSKYDSLKYYLEIILNKLTVLTNQNSNNKSIDLIKNVIDHQDVNGDTCLHLAAKANCGRLVKYLLSYNARDDLININQETAKFLIMNGNLLKDSHEPDVLPENQQQHQHQQVEQAQQVEQLQPAENQYKRPTSQTTNMSSSNPSSRHLETPTQSKYTLQETPDTQRTTVQDDDDDDHDHARVNKEQINELLKNTSNINDDNKENIFLDSMKSFEMSTPIQATKSNSFISNSSINQQPLAVISERTTESTPVHDFDETITRPPKRENNHSIHDFNDNDDNSNHDNNKNKDDHENDIFINNNKIQNETQNQSQPQSYQLIPPKLNSHGKLIEINDNKSDFSLPSNDCNLILNNLINSLTNNYQIEIKKLVNEINQIQKNLNNNESVNEKLTAKLILELSKLGIDEFNSLNEAQSRLSEFVEVQHSFVKEKEFDLMNILEKFQAYQLANLVSNNEENLNGDENNDVNDNNNKDNWTLALELTDLQLARSKLLANLTHKIKNYGIDDKMCKYRKLISLSCGLKIDEIDNLIDGIEESLMDTTK